MGGAGPAFNVGTCKITGPSSGDPQANGGDAAADREVAWAQRAAFGLRLPASAGAEEQRCPLSLAPLSLASPTPSTGEVKSARLSAPTQKMCTLLLP